MAKLIIMLYVSRSGSTLLSDRLAKSCANLLVFPEVDLIEPLVHFADKITGLPINEIVSILTADPRWKDTNISKQSLKTIIGETKTGGPQGVLDGLVRHMVQNNERDVDYVLIKKGTNLNHIERIRSIFPDVIVINIYRDPRAVLASMIKNERPLRKGHVMGRGDPVYVALHWTQYNKRAQKKSDISVKYEDLVRYEQNTIDSILSEIERIGKITTLRNVSSVVPPILSHRDINSIHKLVHTPADFTRVDGWKEDISEYDEKVVTIFCSELMQSLGYPPRNYQVSLIKKCLLVLHSKFKSFLYKLGLIKLYLNRGGLKYLIAKVMLYLNSMSFRRY